MTTTALRQILVHLDAGRRVPDTVACARRLAAEHGAAVTGAYAALPTLMELPFAPEIGPTAASTLVEMDEERRKLVRSRFDRALSEPGPDVPVQWAEIQEAPLVRSFAQAALCADLLVLALPDPDRRSDYVPRDFNEELLAASGKPALILPAVAQPPRRFGTVVVAWKPTREAARAVAGALPLLQRAERVHVVAWQRPEAAPPVLPLDGWLRLHGVSAQWHRRDEEPSDIGELLLSQAFDLDADLLVMGCYGHSRAREWVLGGASRVMLRSATLPLLMAH